jgi:hypothetical protein
MRYLPPIYHGYPDDTAIIRDQGKVATILLDAPFGLLIDDMKKTQKPIRVTNMRNFLVPWYAVDVLPGTHQLMFTYYLREHRHILKTEEPIQLTVDLQAGHFYYLEANFGPEHKPKPTASAYFETVHLRLIENVSEKRKQQILNSRKEEREFKILNFR